MSNPNQLVATQVTGTQGSSVVPPPPPPPPGAPPVRTSSPKKHVDLPQYSPISEPDTANNSTSKFVSSKSAILMPDATIEASRLTSLVNISSPQKVEIDVNNNQNDLDIPDHDSNLENSSQNLVNSLDIQNRTSQDTAVPSQTFPDNVKPLPHISIMKRVSTAYKYANFPRKSLPAKKPTSEAHGSDEEVEISEEIKENSFPISSFIIESWQQRSKSFKSSLEEALIIGKRDKTDTAPENSSHTGEQGSSAEDDKYLFEKTHNSILKNKPQRAQGDFYYHKDKFAQVTTKFDGDIGKLAPTDFEPSKYKFDVHLSEQEVKNIQSACSYGLYSESHAVAYVKASRLAINQVLLHLNPETQAQQIQQLQDAKYMLYGAANALDETIKQLVYIHAGFTAQLRADFLQAMGSFLPVHVRQGLLFELFGNSGLFSSQIHKYVPDIQAYHDKMHKDQFAKAVAQALAASRNKYYDGFKIPKVQQPQQTPPQYDQSFRGRGRGGRGGGRGRGRGRGGANATNTQPHPNQSSTPMTKSDGNYKKRAKSA